MRREKEIDGALLRRHLRRRRIFHDGADYLRNQCAVGKGSWRSGAILHSRRCLFLVLPKIAGLVTLPLLELHPDIFGSSDTVELLSLFLVAV
jgi:hypothetical protein